MKLLGGCRGGLFEVDLVEHVLPEVQAARFAGQLVDGGDVRVNFLHELLHGRQEVASDEFAQLL